MKMNNKKQLKLLEKIAVKVEALADTYAAMTDARLKECTSLFKARLESGESLDSVLPEAFAVVREAAKRVLNMYHFHVQVLGGIALHQGRICQMSTGEGKTLVSTMPAYLNALTGRGVHIVTVNEYLARRDSEWMGKIFKFLGLSVGVIYNDMPLKEKQRAYACDITYGTNNEFGFDYLRDNMAVSKSQLVQRGLNFAIVDEVDSILIDEARTPLIISGRSGKSNEMYITANRFVKTLTCGIEKSDEGKGKLASVMGEGYNEEDEEKYDAMKNEKDKAVRLTARGVAKAERFFKVDNLGDVESTELNHYINQALKAVFVMKRDDDYIVDKGEVKIVDEFTGRIMEGRRYNQGLHQAIEAKENVRIQEENKTLATITFQNLFRMYKKLSGMTGTAKTEEAEFNDIYNLDVVEIPTNKPMIRKDYDDVLYSTREAKLRNLVADIVERHKSGQPMLIGTVSVEKSEELSAMLKKKGVPHNVLNAKNNAREAEIVAQAGRLNAVTIATNMAGRGTDILLGGNPEYLAKQEMERNNYTHEQIEAATSYADGDGETERLKAVYRALFDKYKAVCDAEKEKVLETGGLHIIGTERHESRRIDNQLRGRSGRQGDPGSSVFFLSTEDDLARVFGGERMQAVMQFAPPLAPPIGRPVRLFFKLEEDVPIEAKIITRQIERAQKSIEGIHYSQRKHVLQYDEVNNKQRQVIYGDRNKVLNGEDVHGMILDMAAGFARKALEDACDGTENSRLWNLDAVNGILKNKYLPQLEDFVTRDMAIRGAKHVLDELSKEVRSLIEERAAEEDENEFKQIERYVLLKIIDEKWMEHIDDLEELRKGIGLMAYGQQDPVMVYRKRATEMFEQMEEDIEFTTIRCLLFAKFRRVEAEEVQNAEELNPNLVLNKPCPCGSGLKYKNCCGKEKAEELKRQYRENKKNKQKQ